MLSRVFLVDERFALTHADKDGVDEDDATITDLILMATGMVLVMVLVLLMVMPVMTACVDGDGSTAATSDYCQYCDCS